MCFLWCIFYPSHSPVISRTPDRMSSNVTSVAIRVRTILSGDFDQRAAIWAVATANNMLMIWGKTDLM